MRTYITPVKLHRFSNNIPDTCFKRNELKGTLFHCIWECREIRKFWKEVNNKIKLPFEPKVFILQLYPCLDMCILQAKRFVALQWKKFSRPRTGRWLRAMAMNMSMEKFTYVNVVKCNYALVDEI